MLWLFRKGLYRGNASTTAAGGIAFTLAVSVNVHAASRDNATGNMRTKVLDFMISS